MDLEELRQLVAQGESDRLEFKRTTGELREAAETLCGFLNEQGGRVLFGVANNGRILGQQIADSTLQDVGNTLHRLEPSVHVARAQVMVRDDLQVLILEVPAGEDGPYTFDSRPYQRVGTTTQRMPSAEYERRILARLHSQHRWENRVAEKYSLDDLDLAEIERTHRIAMDVQRLGVPFTSPADTLDRFGLREEGQLLQAAVVLFGRKMLPHYPQCELRMARFRGTSKNEFIDQRQVRAHAFQLFDEASLFLERHVPVAGWFEEGKWERQERPQYPFPALREAIVNALCHRDYSVPGGAIHLAMYDDRLEIISTGLLPPGITIEQLKTDHPSRLRNPLIAEPFYRRALIEKWGWGTRKIIETCLAGGYSEPEFFEQAGAVYVRFPAGAYSPPTQASHNLTDRQREILSILSDGRRWRFRDIYSALSEEAAERTVRDDLQMLRSLGLVESAGRSVAARWWLRVPSGEE